MFVSFLSKCARFITGVGVVIGSVGYIASAPPTFASAHICEVYGSYCVGATTVADGDPVIEQKQTNARLIFEDKLSDGDYYLKFVDNESLCVAGVGTAFGSNSIIKDCGDTFTEWAKQIISGHVHWGNTSNGTYLTGADNGSQMFLSTPCTDHCYQAFDN
jgi:hypothetical protein